jgi:tRNA pseudouridine38-40 synthase
VRYFLKVTYRGTPFVGWQIQPNGPSVQQCLEENLSKILKKPLRLAGCGRTDTGVHALEYFAHFDWDADEITPVLKERLNRILPAGIAVSEIFPVQNDLHARFSATRRTYHYYLTGTRDPFRQDLVYAFPGFARLDKVLMQEAAVVLTRYDSFYPFCKSRSDVDHHRCTIFNSSWKEINGDFVYEITANRFLRGMVRLIVGMCIQVGQQKLTLEEVKEALNKQTSLIKSLSVPAHGLFLCKVQYEDSDDPRLLGI